MAGSLLHTQYNLALAKMDRVSDNGRFTFTEIANYLREGSYSSGYSKADKLALRKRSKYFKLKDSLLYYVGGGKTLTIATDSSSVCRQ